MNIEGKMDSNNLSAPTIIQLVGLPGSGKSFFANQFAETFGSSIISTDKIRWILFAHHTYSQDEESIIAQISSYMLNELIKTRKTIILDGGYNNRTARAQLISLAKKNKYRLLTVIVQTDDLTSRKRSAKRDNKNPIDQYKQPIDKGQYEHQAKSYHAPTIDQNCVVISGKHTYSTQARVVLKKLLEMQKNPISTQPVNNRPKTTARLSGPFIQ